jgi:hypothetical protein
VGTSCSEVKKEEKSKRSRARYIEDGIVRTRGRREKKRKGQRNENGIVCTLRAEED